MALADTKNLADLDGSQSVSALGLRWAALRGMLASPLIMTEDQRPLREELLRELANIEQDFSMLPSRNAMEISAKIDIAKSALQERSRTEQSWLVELLESIQSDLQSVQAKPVSAARPTANLTRSNAPRPDDTQGSTAVDTVTASAA